MFYIFRAIFLGAVLSFFPILLSLQGVYGEAEMAFIKTVIIIASAYYVCLAVTFGSVGDLFATSMLYVLQLGPEERSPIRLGWVTTVFILSALAFFCTVAPLLVKQNYWTASMSLLLLVGTALGGIWRSSILGNRLSKK